MVVFLQQSFTICKLLSYKTTRPCIKWISIGYWNVATCQYCDNVETFFVYSITRLVIYLY